MLYRRSAKILIGSMWILLLSLSPLVSLSDQGEGEAHRCALLRKDLEHMRSRLSEYINALQKSYDRDDLKILPVLTSKVAELTEQISKLEEETANCGDPKPLPLIRGLSGSRSDESEFPAATCGELRKKLIQLVKTVHELKKREYSLLSDLTVEEKTALREASENLKSVRAVLKARCSAPPPPKPFRANPRSAERH